VLTAKPEAAIMLALSLIDLSLAANLLVIVILSGYENFVSRIDTASHEDRPEWMGSVDYSGMKMKLIASVAAISAIALLKAFLQMSDFDIAVRPAPRRSCAWWLVIVHLTFVLSGLLMALMDYVNSKIVQALIPRREPSPRAGRLHG
jgi:uncharacterized protein (TIGR00645 family)